MEQSTVTVRGGVSSYEINNVLANYSRAIEDLSYKVSVLEDGIATLSAYVSELKECEDTE